MVIDEIFPNPTVKQRIFEIRFPNLFFLEDKMGDLQLRVMNKFPDTSLIFRRQVVFVDKGPEGKLEKLPPPLDEEVGKKIWRFRSDMNYEFNVTSSSLHITSKYHKTYNLGEGDKFRDVIKLVCDNFFEVVGIPIIKRLGFRYIDECPLPSKDNATFGSYYNSVFPIGRFDMADAQEMDFRTVVKKNDFNLTYMESLRKIEDGYKLILDFDGFANDVRSEDYLRVTDELHRIILEEFERTVKEPVFEYMRQERVGNE